MKGAKDIYRFPCNRAALGEEIALVTITDVIGPSFRALGTHMGVSATGACVGSISGGCIEATVLGEAKRVIKNGRTELLRLGAGSHLIDICLPCGGGMDLLIVHTPSIAVLEEAIAQLEKRQPFNLRLSYDGNLSLHQCLPFTRNDWNGREFFARHDPELRLVIVGHSAETEILASLGCIYGAEIVILSPDEAINEKTRHLVTAGWYLKSPARSPYLRADNNTAVVMLFHDHDWEVCLLQQALEEDAFYVGAMGSRQTHALRLASLAARGVSQGSLDRLTGPIGLIPASRDPDTLALSTLSQIVAEFQSRSRSLMIDGGKATEAWAGASPR